MTPPTELRPPGEAEDPRIRRSWLVLSGTFVALGVLSVVRLLDGGFRPLDLLAALLVVALGVAAVRNRAAVRAMETGRRAEAESFARILQGLSRSISADAIVDAIVEELAVATSADHVVIVRRRPESRVLEATLVTARAGASSSTLFPISDLEDPADRDDVAHDRAARRGTSTGASLVLSRPAVDAASAGRRAPVAVAERPDAPRSGRRAGRRVPDLAPPAAPLARSAAPPSSVPPERRVGTLRRRGADPATAVAERIERRAQAVFGLRNTLVAPLTTDEGQVGALIVSRRVPAPWPASAQRILVAAAVEASAALARAYSHRAAEARASTDGLTGLPNRRYFDEFCALLARRRRAGDDVGVLMIDIDRFKALNDRHGHQVGDDVLREVAGAIAAAVREDDVPARYGGEEFAVLLRNPTPSIALDVGERVRTAVGVLDLRPLGIPRVSVSVGAAVATGPEEPIPAVIERADRALYLAKRRGRDRVVSA